MRSVASLQREKVQEVWEIEEVKEIKEAKETAALRMRLELRPEVEMRGDRVF